MEQNKQILSLSKLTEAGVQIGLSARRWNPLMRPFIKGKKGKFHIIDLNKTQKVLESVYRLVYDVTAKGGKILFVGTKNEHFKEELQNQCKRVKANYVTQRWLGGTITNFKYINNSITKLNDLVQLDMSGEITKYTKKEQIVKRKEIEKLLKFYGGIRTMRGTPDLVIVVDPKAEYNAVLEARKAGIPTIGIANTNGTPDDTDLTIPANTLSIKSLSLIIQTIADAIAEAKSEPTLVVGKKDEDIILIEDKKPEFTPSTNNKRFSRFQGERKYPNKFGTEEKKETQKIIKKGE